jgi:hypothetical protein
MIAPEPTRDPIRHLSAISPVSSQNCHFANTLRACTRGMLAPKGPCRGGKCLVLHYDMLMRACSSASTPSEAVAPVRRSEAVKPFGLLFCRWGFGTHGCRISDRHSPSTRCRLRWHDAKLCDRVELRYSYCLGMPGALVLSAASPFDLDALRAHYRTGSLATGAAFLISILSSCDALLCLWHPYALSRVQLGPIRCSFRSRFL